MNAALAYIDGLHLRPFDWQIYEIWRSQITTAQSRSSGRNREGR